MIDPSLLTDAAKFAAAIRAFRKRVIMNDDAFTALADRNHDRAFTVADVASLDLIADVWRALDHALENGTDFREFKKAVGEKLKAEWQGLSDKQEASRVATIFRTNTQKSYNHGRWQQLEEPEIKRLRPYRLFDAISDRRTTPICRECDGTLLPADHPFWDSHCPPLHHQCRSTVRSLRASAARRKGITTDPPRAQSQQGFGARPQPLPTLDDVEPDLAEYPQTLARLYEQKQNSRRANR